jgi:hypothetical protein
LIAHVGEIAIEKLSDHPDPDLMLYIGAGIEARTRLALAKLAMTPRSLIVVSRAGSASAFASRFSACLSPLDEGNVVPLLGPRRPRIMAMSDGPRALFDAPGCDQIFFESLDARPADALKVLSVASSLGRLAIEKSARVSAGLFAAHDAEALLFEQALVDFGLPKECVIAGWLNGLGNNATRYVRVPASALIDRGLPDLTEKLHDHARVVDFNLRSLKKGTRP